MQKYNDAHFFEMHIRSIFFCMSIAINIDLGEVPHRALMVNLVIHNHDRKTLKWVVFLDSWKSNSNLNIFEYFA